MKAPLKTSLKLLGRPVSTYDIHDADVLKLVRKELIWIKFVFDVDKGWIYKIFNKAQ